MYVNPDFQTKKAFKEAVKAGETVVIYQPNALHDVDIPMNGSCFVEGPHYPKPHTWYAEVQFKDGLIVAIK